MATIQRPGQDDLGILQALGLDPGQHIKSVTIRYAAGEIPTVRIKRYVLSSDGIQQVLERCQLVPLEEEDS